MKLVDTLVIMISIQCTKNSQQNKVSVIQLLWVTLKSIGKFFLQHKNTKISSPKYLQIFPPKKGKTRWKFQLQRKNALNKYLNKIPKNC